MPNPYAPPGVDGVPMSHEPWWRRPSVWLACVEIALGLALGLGGCAASLATDESMAGFAAGVALFVGGGLVALPGALLFGRHRARWLGQIFPIGLALWLLIAWLRR